MICTSLFSNLISFHQPNFIYVTCMCVAKKEAYYSELRCIFRSSTMVGDTINIKKTTFIKVLIVKLFFD